VKSTFSAANFPANLPANWDTLFGQFMQKTPVVVGEWGGKYGFGTGGQMDVTWQNAFVNYLISKGVRNSFYWCYTPNSGDTGGVLDDNLVVRQDKMVLLQKLWGAAPVASTGTVTPPTSTATTLKQPSIMNFSPQSGAVGTVVTINGSGFTGATLAWIGAAKNAVVKIISDTQVQITVPAGATTGAIGIFNPSYAAFTPASFTVAAATAAYKQPGIMSFSPSTGPAGTVVTVNGSGFTGANLAWIGAARNAVVKVISDSQIQVTVPVGATTGAIGIFNPSFAAFTASSFSMR
jgi:hypothetical protein